MANGDDDPAFEAQCKALEDACLSDRERLVRQRANNAAAAADVMRKTVHDLVRRCGNGEVNDEVVQALASIATYCRHVIDVAKEAGDHLEDAKTPDRDMVDEADMRPGV